MKETQTEICIHYWVIDPPEGPISQGVCIHCEEVKEFKNSLEAEVVMWDGIKTVDFANLDGGLRNVYSK